MSDNASVGRILRVNFKTGEISEPIQIPSDDAKEYIRSAHQINDEELVVCTAVSVSSSAGSRASRQKLKDEVIRMWNQLYPGLNDKESKLKMKKWLYEKYGEYYPSKLSYGQLEEVHEGITKALDGSIL